MVVKGIGRTHRSPLCRGGRREAGGGVDGYQAQDGMRIPAVLRRSPWRAGVDLKLGYSCKWYLSVRCFITCTHQLGLPQSRGEGKWGSIERIIAKQAVMQVSVPESLLENGCMRACPGSSACSNGTRPNVSCRNDWMEFHRLQWRLDVHVEISAADKDDGRREKIEGVSVLREAKSELFASMPMPCHPVSHPVTAKPSAISSLIDVTASIHAKQPNGSSSAPTPPFLDDDITESTGPHIHTLPSCSEPPSVLPPSFLPSDSASHGGESRSPDARGL
jgi:hypothetical protein